MKYNSNWPEARRRLTALWRGERMDRPCMSVLAPQPVEDATVVPEPADDEARWLDPSYVVPVARRQLETTWWGGEAVPSALLLAGWVMCLGGTPRFRPDTIWFETQHVDFDAPSPFRHDTSNIWVRKYRALLLAVCKEAGCNDFLVSTSAGLPPNDLISMLMGTHAFMLALADHPEWMAEAILTGAHDKLTVLRQGQSLVREAGHAFWYGNAGWMPFWAPEPYISTQSDCSCMLSPEMFDRFIVPELDVYGQEHNALWYHLDGGDAKQHLPRLLSLPYMRVVQFVPTPNEPDNGPGHMEMYKQIQAAGRIVHIDVPRQNVEPLVRELDPALLILQTTCPSREEGERLLEQSVAWSRKAPSANR